MSELAANREYYERDWFAEQLANFACFVDREGFMRGDNVAAHALNTTAHWVFDESIGRSIPMDKVDWLYDFTAVRFSSNEAQYGLFIEAVEPVPPELLDKGKHRISNIWPMINRYHKVSPSFALAHCAFIARTTFNIGVENGYVDLEVEERHGIYFRDTPLIECYPRDGAKRAVHWPRGKRLPEARSVKPDFRRRNNSPEEALLAERYEDLAFYLDCEREGDDLHIINEALRIMAGRMNESVQSEDYPAL